MSRAVALALLCGVLGLAAVARADGPPPPPPLTDIGVDDKAGALLPADLPLVDARGRARRLGDFLQPHKPLLLVLAYSRCSVLCNLVLRGMADAVRQMKSRPDADYTIVTVSIDPAETPDSAARYQAVIAAKADVPETAWPFLTAGQQAIDTLTGTLGYRYARDEASGQIAHPSVIFVVSPDGRLAQYIEGTQYAPADVERALALAASGTVTEDSGVLASLLSCFRFDPTRRKYGPLIVGALQTLAVMLILGLLVTTLVLLRKERRT